MSHLDEGLQTYDKDRSVRPTGSAGGVLMLTRCQARRRVRACARANAVSGSLRPNGDLLSR